MKKSKRNLVSQMESLAEEMIQEVKDLKDLTKEELPEVAKEYVRYNTILHLVGMLGFGLLAVVGIAFSVYGVMHEGWTHESLDSATLALTFGGFAILIGGIVSLINFTMYLDFKLQPRRNAIKGITSLF
jgi:uncharacterized membrane protein YukC